MSNSTFAERLKEAMKIRKLKSSQIEKMSEDLVSEQKIKRPIRMPVITDYLKGRYEAAQSNIYALALILNVNEVWLMGEDVPMDRSYGRTNETIQKIPYCYRTDIAEDDPKNFFAIYANDNSMAPLLDVGDIAIIKKYKEFSNRKTYLLKIKNGNPIIRKVIQADNGKIELQAMNMWNFPTQYDLTMDDIEILGEVIKVENNSAFK